MKKLKVIIAVVLLLIALGGGGSLYYYFYQDSNYFSTENAQITANMISLTPEVTGKVASVGC